MKNLIILFLLATSHVLFAQPYGKQIVPINENWTFVLDGQATEKVNLPHCWNKADTRDEINGYFRGLGTYSRELTLPAPLAPKEKVYLYLGAANSVSSVTVNGKLLNEHFGGYSAFEVDITEAMKGNKPAQVQIVVSNAKDTTVPPLSADYNSYGGLYRGCSLIVRGANAFEHEYASSGYTVNFATVNMAKSTAVVQLRLLNKPDKNTSFQYNLLDWNGKVIKTDSWPLADATVAFTLEDAFKLWSPSDPKCYRLQMKLLGEGGKLLDSTGGFIAFRNCSFDQNYGFFLNSRPLKLLGTNRHQDYPEQGWALSDELAVKDIKMIKEMGANFVRLAHYPQSAAVLNACDTLGLLVWEEIPLVDYVKASPMLTRNSTNALREMIFQHRNHPSVIVWGLMNEIYLQMTDAEKFGGQIKHQKQLDYAAELARILHEEAKALDPKRYTAIAFHQDPDMYFKSKIYRYPDILSWNIYKGWYGGSVGEFKIMMTDLKERLRGKILGISEFGAGYDERISSASPEKFDFSAEYQEFLLNQYLNVIKETQWLAFGLQWSFNDFQSDFRGDVQPHINNKGLLTEWRKKKLGYDLFKAHTFKKNYVKVAAGEYPIRVHWAPANTEFVYDTVSVYCPNQFLKVQVNGSDRFITPQKGPIYRVAYKAFFGRNTIIGINGPARDTAIIRHQINSANLADFAKNRRELCLNFGAKYQFYDADKKQMWWPMEAEDCKQYSGITYSGVPSRCKTWFGDKPMFDYDVTGTNLEPMFQSRVDSLTELYLPLPEGKYKFTFHYSLLPQDLQTAPNLMQVQDNAGIILANIIATQAEINKALQNSFTYFVKSNGIKLKLNSSVRNFILNGLVINKL